MADAGSLVLGNRASRSLSDASAADQQTGEIRREIEREKERERERERQTHEGNLWCGAVSVPQRRLMTDP